MTKRAVDRVHNFRCGECGRRGHNRRTCPNGPHAFRGLHYRDLRPLLELATEIDIDDGTAICRVCKCPCVIPPDLEPTALCNLCAQAYVYKLASVVEALLPIADEVYAISKAYGTFLPALSQMETTLRKVPIL